MRQIVLNEGKPSKERRIPLIRIAATTQWRKEGRERKNNSWTMDILLAKCLYTNAEIVVGYLVPALDSVYSQGFFKVWIRCT